VFGDPARIDPELDSRAATFENPSGARGAGGRAAGGRKGAPSRTLAAGETVTLADLEGPGTIRHLWCAVTPMAPEQARGLRLEVRYDGLARPSISVPLLDFFGLVHGRRVAYSSALTAVHEGRGLNAWFPMPFRDHVRVELANGSDRACEVYYQLDFTLEPVSSSERGLLHAEFRRENPTTLRRDFLVTDRWQGPGRFLGAAIGVRTIDPALWYGEGEVKIFRDGDREHPTICGTGLEDYVGSAWGMGPHHAPFGGAPLEVKDPDVPVGAPDLVGFYRWHVADPIVFHDALRVTVQQIGWHLFPEGQEELAASYRATNPPAGPGPVRDRPDVAEMGIYERVDDCCATAFVYCERAQEVRECDVTLARADVTRLPYEHPDPDEELFR